MPAFTLGARRLLFLDHSTTRIVSNFLLWPAIDLKAHQLELREMKGAEGCHERNMESTELTVRVRGRRVIVDADLARLYGVKTKHLKEQVKRNAERFPQDFMFEMTHEEVAEVVAVCDHLKELKFSSILPVPFTDRGAVMAANVLNSRLAIEASIMVVRAFIHAREILAEHLELRRRLEQLETRGLGLVVVRPDHPPTPRVMTSFPSDTMTFFKINRAVACFTSRLLSR